MSTGPSGAQTLAKARELAMVASPSNAPYNPEPILQARGVKKLKGQLKGQIKNIGKSLLYQAWTPELVRPIKLGYVFHTEAIFEDALFTQLIRFCEDYTALTAMHPICTLMPATSARIVRAMSDRRMRPDTYADRARQLSKVATMGYHGHFWHDPKVITGRESEIRDDRYSRGPLREQFLRDVNWFKEEEISHHTLYSAGWWFMHPELLELLAETGFRVDFSFSKSPWFRNPYSQRVLRQNRIQAGEPVFLETSKGKILSIQNLIGCHTTPFPQDFVRNVNQLFTGENEATHTPQFEALAVTNSHDYDLHPEHTLNCLRWLKKSGTVEFIGKDQILSTLNQPFRILPVSSTQ